MSSVTLRTIEDAFHEALELDDAARAAFLDQLRERDGALHAEVVALLAVERDADSRVQRAIDGAAAHVLTSVARARIGRRIGAYELVELLGEGGMGSVYRAVRADAEYQRAVAIKVLRPGAASAHMVARLRDERQILAALDHPGIVRLLDGGSTDEGAPYLVLEYIEAPRSPSTSAPARSRCAPVSSYSCACATPSSTRISASSFIETSSRPTSSSARAEIRSCSTSASRSCSRTRRHRAKRRRERGTFR